MSALALAQARAAAILDLAATGTARTAARRLTDADRAALYRPDHARSITLSADVAQKSTVIRRVAATLIANDIAANVAAADRAALAEHLAGADRTFALTHRRLARAATGARGAACAKALERAIAEVEAAWPHLQPFGTAQGQAPADIDRMRLALGNALNARGGDHD